MCRLFHVRIHPDGHPPSMEMTVMVKSILDQLHDFPKEPFYLGIVKQSQDTVVVSRFRRTRKYQVLYRCITTTNRHYMKPGIDFQRTFTSSTKYEAILETTFEYQRCRRSSIPSSSLGGFWNPKGGPSPLHMARMGSKCQHSTGALQRPS